ncbi:toxin YoeB [Desulfitobacterium sp. LBE]|uniref:Endoribonuclease YoeB n=3 Tax=root TaxID=1 RepID=A0A0W1JJJ9_DESHA|nr:MULTISPECIES: Txe/YoeB family addiction module toxin [Desulfitobacterium]EHL05844.1 addiction module toxin, Txe/YoeB family [Desulfitobacterium hafniense DP7]KTE91712.1 addiction module protein [Desulfitobacterium hafniense]MEA5022929.1 Txe/YoeB family addiction module toxin [Desulfitobacterium hafniense]TWH57104.1 toxin YoeB [Desulfitobacterium sp. LBE]
MKKLWTDQAWADYLYWQSQDKKTLRRINQLLLDIEHNGYDGIGKPEQLRGDLTGWCSRRIDNTNRLVYRMTDGIIVIASCRTHYGNK